MSNSKSVLNKEEVIPQEELLEIGEEIANFSVESETDVSDEKSELEILPVSDTRVFAFWDDIQDDSNKTEDSPNQQLKVQSTEPQTQEQDHFAIDIPGNNNFTYFDLWKSGQLVEVVLGKNYNAWDPYSNSEAEEIQNEPVTSNAVLETMTTEVTFQSVSNSASLQLPITQHSELQFLSKDHNEGSAKTFTASVGFTNLSKRYPSVPGTHDAKDHLPLITQHTEYDFSSSLEQLTQQHFLFDLEGTIASIQFTGKLTGRGHVYFFGKELSRIDSDEFVYFYPIQQMDFDVIRSRLFQNSSESSTIPGLSNLQAILHFRDLQNAELMAEAINQSNFPAEFVQPLSIAVPPPSYLISGININE